MPTTVDADAPPDRRSPDVWSLARSWWRRMVDGPRGTVLAVALVALAILLPLRTLFRYQGPPMEEGFMLVFPERILNGDIANRDFLHLYGPGGLWALAGWYKMFGTTLASERIYGLLQHLGIIFGLFTLALPWGRKVATACGLLGVLLVVTPIGLTALAWNGAVALGIIGIGFALRGLRRIDEPGATGLSRGLVGAGLFWGVALSFRPDLIVGLGLTVLALVWRRPARDTLVPVMIGLVPGALTYVIHIAMAGFGPSFEGMVVQPVFDLRGGRTLPIPPSWSTLDGALQSVAQLRVPDWPLPMLPASAQVTIWFLALPVAAFAILGTGMRAVRREPERARSRTLLVVGAFGVGLLPQALQRPDTTHLAWVSCVCMVFAPVAVAQWVEWRTGAGTARGPSRRARLAPGIRTLIAAFIPVLATVLVLPAYTARTYVDLVRQNATGDYFGWPVRNGDRVFYLGAADLADNAQALVDELEPRLNEGDRLFVGTADLRKTPYGDAYFYFLLPEATPATRYIEMDPGIANAPDSGLADEVAGADWLILSHVWDTWDEPNDSRDLGSAAPNRVIEEQFCQVGDYNRQFALWQRCATG